MGLMESVKLELANGQKIEVEEEIFRLIIHASRIQLDRLRDDTDVTSNELKARDMATTIEMRGWDGFWKANASRTATRYIKKK